VTGIIHLIGEHENDADVVNAILKAMNIDMRAKALKPPGGSGGISRIADNIEALIKTAIQKRQKGDCIAVLHDADVMSERRRANHDRIKTVCEKYREDVKLVIAEDEIEAWLLADEGLCRWLNENPEKSSNNERKPSERLNRAVKRKTGKSTGRMLKQVLAKLDGSGDKHSDSLKKALKHLHNAPCMRQN
jgi:thymidylate synthase